MSLKYRHIQIEIPERWNVASSRANYFQDSQLSCQYNIDYLNQIVSVTWCLASELYNVDHFQSICLDTFRLFQNNSFSIQKFCTGHLFDMNIEYNPQSTNPCNGKTTIDIYVGGMTISIFWIPYRYFKVFKKKLMCVMLQNWSQIFVYMLGHYCKRLCWNI